MGGVGFGFVVIKIRVRVIVVNILFNVVTVLLFLVIEVYEES